MQPIVIAGLYPRTLKLLRERPRSVTLKMISEDTGLPEGWLLSILTKQEIRPNVDRVEILFTYLSGKPLTL